MIKREIEICLVDDLVSLLENNVKVNKRQGSSKSTEKMFRSFYEKRERTKDLYKNSKGK